MARFVAMGILTNQAGNVRCLAYHSIRSIEQIIQVGGKGFLATEQLNHTVHIVRHEETILPSGCFGKLMTHCSRIELFFPVAVQTLAVEETDIAVEHVAIVQGTFHVFLIDIFLAHILRHLSDSPIVVSILQQARNRFTLDVGRNESILGIIIRTLGILVRRNHHCFQCLFHIIATDALHVCIGNDGSRVITNHCTRFARRKRPDRKFASHFVHVEQRLYHVVHQGRIGQGHQRMPCTERIPSRERRISGLSFRSHCYAAVVTTILVVDIVGTVRHHQRMIPGGIEISALRFGSSLHTHDRKFFFPSRFRLLADSIEVEVRHVMQQILTGILHADDREAHLGNQFTFLSETCHSLLFIDLLQLLNRFGELKHKIDVLIVHPATGTAHSHQFIVGSLLHFRFVDEIVRVQDMCQIHNHRCILVVQVRIAVHAGKGRGSQLYLDLFIRQFYGIIARTCFFGIVRESSRQEDVSLPSCTDRLCRRTKQHIAQVLTSRTAQVSMRETEDGRVGIVIARAGIPIAPTGIGTQLHCPERSRRTRISMSMETCPDKGIYIINRSFLWRGTRTEQAESSHP